MRMILITAVLALAVGAIGCGSKEVDSAKQFMEAGMYEQAVALLQMEVGTNPKNAEAHYLLGTCHLLAGDRSDAQQSFERATLLEPKYRKRIGEAYVTAATSRLQEKELRQAKRLFSEAIEDNFLSKTEVAQIMIETIQQWPPDPQQARTLAQTFSGLAQEVPELREQIGKACMTSAKKYVELKMFDEGEKLLDVALELDPRHIKPAAQLFFGMGQNMLVSRSDTAKALRLLDRSMELSPDMREDVADLSFKLAKQYLKDGDTSGGLSLAGKSRDLDPKYIDDYQSILQKMGVIFRDDFPYGMNSNWKEIRGRWIFDNGYYRQTDERTGGARSCAVTIPDIDNYLVEVNALKNSGQEGFLIIFKVHDKYCWWNIGGWRNRYSMVEGITNADETRTDDQVTNGHIYNIRIQVKNNTITGWLDGIQKWSVVRESNEVIGLPASDSSRGRDLTGLIGLGTWATAASFDNVKVTAM